MASIIIGIFILVVLLVLLKEIKLPYSFFENQKIREELYKLKLFKGGKVSEDKKIDSGKNHPQEDAS